MLQELHINRQGQNPRGPDVGLSKLLEGTVWRSYPLCMNEILDRMTD